MAEGSNNSGNWIGTAAAALSPIGGLLNSRWDRKESKRNQDRTIQANKAEAELAYQRQVEMWNMQNEYNSPEAQMNRFKAAGLNPHLIYGQGNPGNASAPPSYHPPSIQYSTHPRTYGTSIQSLLPTLMSVGTWMQDMRVKEVGIQRTLTQTEQADQLINFLQERNPLLLQEAQNRLSLYPYQSQMLANRAEYGRSQLWDMAAKFRTQYGDDLFKASDMVGSKEPIGGLARLKFLQEEASARLKQAQASFTDFDITNPQAIMQLVLSGVLGMAGTQLKLSNVRRPTTTHEVTESMRSGRTRTRRRIYQHGR